ncbi:MAG: signal peptide peptidase SppA [Dehalococcoidia bacterium]
MLPKKRVAVVELHGTIGAAIRSQQFVPMLKRLREDDRTAAVVLDIDSPGGSATVSDYLYLEVRKIADKKPVIAFVRGTCASGSYYVACAASLIIAQRSSVIGSIGVMLIRPEMQDLLSKIGVHVAVTTTGPYKGMGLPFREVTPAEERKNQAMADRFFGQFIQVVAEGRRVPLNTAETWATGEVWWATEAKEMRMVDELGDLERATQLAAEQGGIEEHTEVVRPRQPLGQRLISRVAYSMARAAGSEFERLLTTRTQT